MEGDKQYLGSLGFQFYKVRLKHSMDDLHKPALEFQFYKVRLKLDAEAGVEGHDVRFNSIKFD